MMEPTSLTQFYDDLKSKTDGPTTPPGPLNAINSNFIKGPNPIIAKNTAWKINAAKNCEELKDKCAKHIILDIYVKTLPLDKDYVQCNLGQCKNDIDSMLAQKNMTGVQYLKSCYEKTHAPLLEFLNRSIDVIGREYMREADEQIKDANENEIELPPQESPTTDEKEVNSQLVDIKEDPEYETFIDKLKGKTINKIVSDITKIINDKKEDKNMEFDLKGDDSAVQESMHFLEEKLLKAGKEISADKKEEMIGLAVREATLFEIDTVFQQRTFKEFTTAIRLGRGAVINESAVESL